jgi:hypothetical protein
VRFGAAGKGTFGRCFLQAPKKAWKTSERDKGSATSEKGSPEIWRDYCDGYDFDIIVIYLSFFDATQ